MEKNDSAMNAILKGVTYLINKAISNAPFDKVVSGIVTNIGGNTVDVIVNGITYTNVATMIDPTQLQVNHVVKILVPQNRMADMFILGKIL